MLGIVSPRTLLRLCKRTFPTFRVRLPGLLPPGTRWASPTPDRHAPDAIAAECCGDARARRREDPASAPHLMRPWRISGARAPTCDAANPRLRSGGHRRTGAPEICAPPAHAAEARLDRASGSVGPDWSELRLVLRSEEASLLRRVASAACGAKQPHSRVPSRRRTRARIIHARARLRRAPESLAGQARAARSRQLALNAPQAHFRSAAQPRHRARHE